MAASFYPVQFLAERIGGEHVEVTGLTPPGTEPHDLALDGKTRAALADADVALYLGLDFQPDVQDAVDALPDDVVTLDLLDANRVTLRPAPSDLGKGPLSDNKDPHVWLSPTEMVAMSEGVAAALSEADPERAPDYEANQAELAADLTALDQEFKEGLAHCANTTIVTSHAAFGYLAHDYGLTQVAIAGLSPDDEPDATTLAAITDAARESGVGTVFFEEAFPPDLAETVAEEIGAETSLLAALEFDPPEGEDYLSVMRGNLNRLIEGLDCR